MSQATETSAVRIQVLDGGLTATLEIDASAAPEGVPPAVVAAILRNSRLNMDKERIEKLASMPGNVRLPKPIVIAKGRAPVDAAPARIELIHTASATNEQKQDHHERSTILVAAKGQEIGRLCPAVKGRDGLDVFGKPLPFKSSCARSDTLGRNCQLLPDGTTIIATVAGVVKQVNQQICVEPELHVAQHVDYSVGNIDFPGDVHVPGNIADLFQVRCNGSLTVGGVVDAAQVNARGDMVVTGGIAGKGQGHCSVGGNLQAHYITNANIRCGGDVVVDKEIDNCQVLCGGSINAKAAAIRSGQVSAAGSITCHTLGSAGGVLTVVEIGVDRLLRERCSEQMEQIRQSTRRAGEIRRVVEPLMQHRSKLTHAQKEKATELLCDAEEIEEQVACVNKELAAACQAMSCGLDAELHVTEILHAGCTIRFSGIEAVVDTSLRGPLVVRARRINGTWHILIFDVRGGTQPLVVRTWKDEVVERLRQTVSARAAGVS